jgi:hypothetical protein
VIATSGASGLTISAAIVPDVTQQSRSRPHRFSTARIARPGLGDATNVPAHGASKRAALLTAVDRALHAAKDNGRDRLVMAGQMVARS